MPEISPGELLSAFIQSEEGRKICLGNRLRKDTSSKLNEGKVDEVARRTSKEFLSQSQT